MPVEQICTSGTSNAMTSEEVNDPVDNFIRQVIGKEPVLPFSRTADSPVQWIQLLHALDQPDLPGWPLLTPLKVQMQKCEKCSREFCSPINYRRHIRVHRRSLNVKKESQRIRDLLAVFWDKMSLEEAKEAVSFDDVMLKEIPGSSVIRALSSSLRKPAVWTLPKVYVRAGSALLDIIQAKPSRGPISSRELFSVLDDASERTFLCAGTADSVQKYVFDGETAKNSLELKNLVAATSFLFEQQLVKAWLADKDAEALRCQKLLVEEEEAAQKRQAAVLEKKKQKKLQLKEQKVREQFFTSSNEDLEVIVDAAVDRAASPDASALSSPSESSLNSNLDSSPEFVQSQIKEAEEHIEAQLGSTSDHFNQKEPHATKHQMVGAPKGHRHPTANRWQGPKSQRGGRYGYHPNQTHQASKPEIVHKLSHTKGPNIPSCTKVWTKKTEADSDGINLKPSSAQAENNGEPGGYSCELIIGSIPVTLKSASEQRNQDIRDVAQHIQSGKKKASEKQHIKPHIQSGNRQKLWRPVSRGETKGASPEPEGIVVLEKVNDRIVPSEAFMKSQSAEDGHINQKQWFNGSANIPFSSNDAREFLARRWKEAIESEHVTLVLSPRQEPPDISTTTPDASDHQNSVVDNVAERQPIRNSQVKFRKKGEKNLKTKYMPKQKPAT